MNIFTDCLEYSRGERERFDCSILKDHFIWVENVQKTNVETDKEGIDYIVVLKDGSQFSVDAKTRQEGCSRYWKDNIPELCLEKYSVCEKKIVGWLFKKSEHHPDYILYTFPRKDSPKYYIIPYQLLKKAAYKYWQEWERKYGEYFQRNDNWTSSAIFVPAPVVLGAIQEFMQGQI